MKVFLEMKCLTINKPFDFGAAPDPDIWILETVNGMLMLLRYMANYKNSLLDGIS